MANMVNLRVHIAPVGFEIDRIVISAKRMKADKVWLLVHENPSQDKATRFIEKIRKELKKAKINVELLSHNRLDLFMILKSVKEIIEKEKENNVYVNVSSGSKIQAIGCMMACMMFNEKENVKPFYVEAEHYLGFEGTQQSTGIKELVQLPSYKIHTPKRELIEALRIIKENKGRMPKKDMAAIAVRDEIITVNAREENYEQALYASLDKNIIQPLSDEWKFIEIEKIGRTRWIKMTDDGFHAAEFLV